MARRILEGQVVSNKNTKTVIVLIRGKKKHPKYGKYVYSTKRIAAHDESDAVALHSFVTVQENKPISKTKKWVVIGVKDK